MKAAMYLRKSRADDAHETVETTLQRHEDSLRELALSQGIEIVTIYREVVSGEKLSARAQMQRLLSDCNTDKFSCVLCMDIDRLGRGSMAEQGYILDTLKAAGVHIVTPRKVYNLSDDLDETYSEFESFMARQELKLIKRRLQRGVIRTAEEGGFLSAPPYGYQRSEVNGRPSLSPVTEEAEVVRQIFDWYIHKGLGCQQIAERLNAMGVLPRQAATFGRTTILDILKNPVYYGMVQRKGLNGTINTEGLHPPLISERDFFTAAAIRRERAHPPSAKHTQQNPLAGLVFCGFCGAPMQRLPASRTRRQESLACPRKGCNVASRLDMVEWSVMNAVLPLLPTIIQPHHTPLTSDPLTTQRRRIQEQLARLYPLVEKGVYTAEEFAQRRAALTAQSAAFPPPPSNILPKPIDTVTAYQRADAAGRNTFWRLVIHKIMYKKEPGALPYEFSLDIEMK